VDDEASVVDALSIRIPWRELGIHDVHSAYSAYEAITILTQYSIDIAIMDISMPGMSGIELLEWIKKSGRRTRCVMLSGHADFEYARQSLDHAAVRYVLKPASDDELMEIVSAQLDLLKKEWEVISSHQNTVNALNSHLPLLRSYYLNELLQGRTIPAEETAKRLQLLQLTFRQGMPFVTLLIRMEEGFTAYDSRSMALFEYAIGNMAEELFRHSFYVWLGKDSLDYLVLLIQPRSEAWLDDHNKEARRCAAELQSNVNHYLKGRISIVVGEESEFPAVKRPYDHAVLEMRRSIGNENELLYAAYPQAVTHVDYSLQSLYEPPLLPHLLEAGRWQEASDKLEAIIQELRDRWSGSQEHLLEAYASLLAAFSYIAHRNYRSLPEIAGQSYYLRLTEGNPSIFIRQLAEWGNGMLDKLRQDMEQGRADSRSIIVQKSQAYMEKNLSDDVSLQAIADHVYLNPGYLSKVYKLTTGENISDYLHRLRMEKAAFQLRHSGEKVYRIAELVGYQNPPYFIKVFKKHFGVTPQEFRETLQVDR
jgi:two-component system response regulator YesN